MRSAFWNIFFGFFFLALVLIGTDWLYREGKLTTFIPLGDFFLVALAIFRLTRLVSYDVIFKFLRDWLETKEDGSFLHTFSQLVHCPWCTSLWFSFVVVFAYFATPIAWPIILVLAVAGVAAFIQILANLVGWSAELKKRTVLGPDHKSGSTCG